MDSLELATVYIAPKSTTRPPVKNLPNETPPGWHPPILADGTHSSFLHTILHVRLATFCSGLLERQTFYPSLPR
jgi:hypothetical protein